MKTDIHPTNYRLVVFQDLNNDHKFLMKSTIATQETIKWEDGQTYPLVKLHVTSASHPYYTGLEKMIDVEGRIDKFKARQNIAKTTQAQLQAKTVKAINKKARKPKNETESFEVSPKTIKSVKKPKTKASPKSTKASVDSKSKPSES